MIAAFPSPLDIQFRWAQPLSEALQKDPDGVMLRAKEIQGLIQEKALSAGEVFGRLTQTHSNIATASRSLAIDVAGRRVGECVVDLRGAVTLKLQSVVVPATHQEAVMDSVRIFLKGI